jgi:hypothetical protein
MPKTIAEINQNIVEIINEQQENGKNPMAQMVYDKKDKTLRFNICRDMNTNLNHSTNHHVPMNRKHAAKMIKILEEFILWNQK